MHLNIKNDRFKKVRGGYSRWLIISCEKCKAQVFLYQKDGPGILKRLYIDRIVAPAMHVTQNLICKNCKTILGTRIVYKKENRLVFRLYVVAINKKIINSNKIKRATLKL